MASRDEIIARASNLLGIPYVWGGITQAGMDCSAWLSKVWGVSRQTTDTLTSVASPIAKEQLLPGDAMNLPTWLDPSGSGHVRLFVNWANAEKSLVQVMEETSSVGHSVNRVIAYDNRYIPMRLHGIETGATPLAPAQPSTAQPPQNPESTTVAVPASGAFPLSAVTVKPPSISWISGLEMPQGFTALAQTLADVPYALTAPFVGAINQTASLLAFLGQPNIYKRIGLTILGAILVLIGIVLFALSFVPKDVAKLAASVL